MKRKVPDRHQSIVTLLDGQKITFWYIVAPAEPDVGYAQPYMEHCYVTGQDGERMEVSEENIEMLTDLAFNHQEEP